MATASFSLRPLHRAFSFLNCPQLDLNSRFHPHLRYPSNAFTSIAIRASSTVTLEPEMISEQNQSAELFACPVCYEPLIRKGPSGFNLEAIYRSGFKCKKCNKSYSSKEMYLDLTVTAGLRNYSEDQPAMTELFRSPLVSFLYERGWRQNFRQRGFPGPDEEFKMAQDYFKSVEGGVLIDISCGSGLFSRKFAKSGTYSGVVALDFSENMLRQCYDFIKGDAALLKRCCIALLAISFQCCCRNHPYFTKWWSFCWNHFSKIYSLYPRNHKATQTEDPSGL
ncbi:uncharacterized methyltransferase At2g41040, chloroplastic-like isoform X5 [Ziziphus jujuba]|uniref:Uncharacterized methyltransferase At2g41040, chloroplastic-like isoform X5 n=1 Tax=Ziziphus jujuba TaxID=326968 RepID=A0A6P4B5K4_ZIZJJ|nr:uncharacterized methyltransferase At2g41040, chloroplastic-like isoform X5 [Ziziphus jujuba]